MNLTIIEGPDRWRAWLDSPPGSYVMAWEQAMFDACVSDAFGYFALQLGLPELDCLRENRMKNRFQVLLPGETVPVRPACGPVLPGVVSAQFEELPFASESLDLVALPHVLDRAGDPHQVLREVDRVLRPGGRLLLSGFNPVSLWGARQLAGRGLRRSFLPPDVHFVGALRLRDWLKLLGYGLEPVRYGCYRPAFRSARWLERSGFVERAGDRWWPICGAVYLFAAVKRVHGMRLVGKRPWRASGRTVEGAAVASSKLRDPVNGTCSRGSSAAD
ncbi:MAG: hypothetical protein RIS35_2216 [Pseudomonadota bacterium]